MRGTRAGTRDPKAMESEAIRVGLVCPTMWDEAELPGVMRAGRYRVCRYGSDASEDPGAFDAERFIEETAAAIGAAALDGVFASDDYPGSLAAAAIAERLDLPGPPLRSVLLCHHKYYGRLAQRAAVPEAVPAFALVRGEEGRAEAALGWPAFAKPVKSFFSLYAERVEGPDELRAVVARANGHLARFVQPLDRMLRRFPEWSVGAGHFLAEGLLRGRQCTLEGCMHRGEFRVVGVVDSILYPGTISFRRFEYPSALPEPVRERMAAIAERFVRSIGFDDGLFNAEMMYDEEADRVSIIEVNPRMCPQFADLMEKVNGVNTYEIALDVAAGRRPAVRRPHAPFAFAASLVPRLFEDRRVLRVPDRADIERLLARFPDARLKVLCRVGHRLSEELQDGKSFRYAVLNLGGADREDVLERYREAMDLLPFEFAPP